MARTWQALATLIAVCSSLTNAALYGRNETTVAGSGTISTSRITSLTTSSNSSTVSSSSTSIALSPTSAANTNTTLSSTSTTNSTTTVNVPSSTGLTTFLASSTLWSSSTLLTSFSTSTTGINATVPFPTDTGSAISLTTSLISTDLTSSMPSTSATSTTSVTGSNSTSETTLTSLSSNSSTNITLIPATLSSGSIVETSTITSKISGSGFGTTTTSLSQTSTTTGIPVVTNGQCKGSDCTDGECTGILCVSLGCSGSGCSNGICTGLDCISLGCIGTGCKNGVCTGSCVTSGCEGSDCESTTGECSGSDCISVGCSGSDCDSSTGSCSGPNCTTKTCSGSGCDKGVCAGLGCDDEGTQTGSGTDATTGNPDSPTSSQTPSSSSSCRTQTASLCVAACSVTAIAVNSTTTLTTSCYTTACSATIACSVEATTTSSFTTSISTSNGACMTVIPFSGIASSGSVVSTSYTATEITYTISTVTAKSASSTGMGTSSDSAVTLSTTMTNSTLSTSTDSSSSGTITSSATTSSSMTSKTASTVSCTYQGADPDKGIDGFCICSSSSYSVLKGTSGNMCAYTALPTSTAVVTASAQYTTTDDCYACTVYGPASQDCASVSDCTPTSTTTVATTSASTTTTIASARVTCTLWTDCPACPDGESPLCGGLAGQESCGCLTESSNSRLRRDGQLEAESNDSDFSKLDNPLAKRADVVGDALSCPYSPPAQDTYCTYFGLSKRANAAKEINLPWASALKWSNYPQCPNTGTKGITQVPKFYHPAGASTAQNGIQNYDPTSSQSASTNGRIAGIAQSDFANDHVFEAQLISGFLSWLCGQPSVTGYTQIPWPAGWTQPDTTWCAAVFGSDADAQSGFLFPAFPGDNTGDNNFLGNCAEVTGGVSQPTLMAVYYGPANGWKGKITKAQWPAFSSLSGTVAQQQEQAGVVIRDTANVFQYLRDATIQDAWTTPSKSVETVCVQFDNNFWGSTSAANAPGTALDGPASPQGVVNWGMRTMWAYWIDNHLYKIEQQVPSWVILALGKVGGAGGGFARSYMQANGMVSASQMHFPLDANSPNAPIPGTQGSATSTVSRYMMWDGATHGALGL